MHILMMEDYLYNRVVFSIYHMALLCFLGAFYSIRADTGSGWENGRKPKHGNGVQCVWYNTGILEYIVQYKIKETFDITLTSLMLDVPMSPQCPNVSSLISSYNYKNHVVDAFSRESLHPPYVRKFHLRSHSVRGTCL